MTERNDEMAEFAIIKTGGKQYKVKVGDILRIEKLACILPPTRSENKVKAGDILKIEKLSNDKDKVEFDDILFGKKVSAKILKDMKNPKVVILKHHPKKRYHKTQGHRQIMTEIRIESIK